MSAATTAGPHRLHGRESRLTLRTRLTLAFTGVVAASGVAMVVVVSVFMRTVPAYVAYTVGSPRPSQSGAPTASPETQYQVVDSEPFILRTPADVLNTTVLVSTVVLAIIIALGALLAWFLSGRLLRPLHVINQAAKLASTGSFSHRVALVGPRDEMKDLSDTFDEMLGRLDTAFRAHQRFAANASHELRTPVAATHTMLEVALADPELTVEELRTVAHRVLETNARSAETIDALLDLSEIGQRPLRQVRTDLGRLTHDALAAVRGEIDARGIDVRTSIEVAECTGEERLLRQAIMNLITNAVRHNNSAGIVDIVVGRRNQGATVRIENTGPALTSSLISDFSEPFSRGLGRTAGHGDSPRGHGLGLAIVNSIVKAHGASLALEPRPGGGLIAALTVAEADVEHGSGKSPTLIRSRE